MAEDPPIEASGRKAGKAPTAAAARASQPVAVVGIGASAGGIEALGRFFAAMPADSGCAFVVILHLDPTRESQLAHILATSTTMPVMEVENGVRLAPDQVHVIAPDADMQIHDGVLQLSKPAAPRGQRHPVDVFFASLAAEQRERAVAIVLSGTGSNGTEGLKAVRAEGGLVLVQDPATAKFDGMPRSAIAADLADHVLAPERMPDVLLGYLRHDYVAAPTHDGDPAGGELLLDRILEVLRSGHRHDFRDYKRGTLNRRIHRRLGLNNIATLEAYLDLVRDSADEAATLVKDLMINVTGFFRDPEAWKALAELAITPMVAEHETGAPLRIWVPGCATGEEAYSLAMLIGDHAEAAGKRLDLKIFATDPLEDNLRRARDGVYPAAAVEGLSRDRRRRYFDKLDGTYQIKKALRDIVVFAPQNLLRDPPFSRLDLVSCRNLLIYLEPPAQRRVIALCHFALREGGYLFLGNAESIGRHDDLFETLSAKWRIYRRLGPTRHDIVEFPTLRGPEPPRQPPRAAPVERAAEAARRALLERFAPASVLIDQRARILYFHGATCDYLRQPSGEPTLSLAEMARDGLAGKLRAAVRQAMAEGREIRTDARVRQHGTSRPVAITVRPVAGPSPREPWLLVSFEAAPEQRLLADGRVEDAGSGERALEDELKETRSELQSAIENLETANEELKASHEEVTSMNEELQSTNEELETSKEELQSFNEELHTVNNQLQHQVRALEALSDDLNNLLVGTDTSTLFLDTDLNIKWFAPATRDLFDFVSTDIGRPVSHLARKFADPDLLADATTVLRKLTPTEAEVRSDDGRWYLRRMLPYRTQKDHIAGVVMTFTDITERKRAADMVNEARIFAEAIVETIRHPVLVLDPELRVVSANLAFYQLFQVSKAETEHRHIYDLGNRQWDTAELRQLLNAILTQDRIVSDFEIEHDFRDLGRRYMLLNGRKLAREGDREPLILIAIEDATERMTAAHQKMLMDELNHRVKNSLAAVQAIAAQTLGNSDSLEDARPALTARLMTMAKAHDLLTRGNWVEADLASVVKVATESHGGPERFAADGPPVSLPPRVASSFALALHELATNAAKYGALSREEGRVEIEWRVSGPAAARRLQMRWAERGGPPVTPPARKGFGSRLIERALAAELDGEVRVSYGAAGVVCTIDAPMPTVGPPIGARWRSVRHPGGS